MNSTLQFYKSAQFFSNSFAPMQVYKYLDEENGREKMILKEYPTLTTSKNAFGTEVVKTIIKAHLLVLAQSFGVTSTAEQIDAIAEDILSGYGYLKITEIILAFKMMREGKLRKGDENRAKMFGSLSSEVICDCLYIFIRDYRNIVIDNYNKIKERKRKETEEQKAMTYEERLTSCFCECHSNPALLQFIKDYKWLNEEDMKDLQYFVDERKALLHLKQRVKEYIEQSEKGEDTSIALEKIKKGVAYIEQKFPIDDKQGCGTDDNKS